MNKKLLVTLMAMGLAGIAHAQTNVTIYGIVDNGFIKETGSDITMGQNVLNRIGFKGSEDLGRGYKATFQLEKRFTLNDGAPTGVEWDGAANVGIAGPFKRTADRNLPQTRPVQSGKRRQHAAGFPAFGPYQQHDPLRFPEFLRFQIRRFLFTG